MIKFFRNIRNSLLNEGKTSKYLKYALGEIILVVLGILIALQLNNWNQTRLEQIKIKQYAKSLIEDLNNDIGMIKVSQYQSAKKYKMIDSLRKYMLTTPTAELSSTFLYTVAHDIMYRPYKWHRSTLNELKSSGAMSYFNSDSLQKKIAAYESFSIHLDEDFEFDKSNADKMDNFTSSIIDLNSSHLDKLLEKEGSNFSNFEFNIYETEEYAISVANDLKLISYDPTQLKKFINTLILIQNNYQTRAFNEMHDISEDAKSIISILRNAYNLE